MDVPIACTLSDTELRCEADALLPGLVSIAQDRALLAEGWRLEFAPTGAHLRRIADVIERERRCCAFLRFALEVPAGGAPFVLTVDGPAGTGAFLAGLPATGFTPAGDSAGVG